MTRLRRGFHRRQGFGGWVGGQAGHCRVDVWRGDSVESQHRVHVAIVHAEEGLTASAGNPAHHSFGAEGGDGAWRAVEPALLAALRQIDAIRADELDRLARYAQPAILNTRNETVGSIRARVDF